MLKVNKEILTRDELIFLNYSELLLTYEKLCYVHEKLLEIEDNTSNQVILKVIREQIPFIIENKDNVISIMKMNEDSLLIKSKLGDVNINFSIN